MPKYIHQHENWTNFTWKNSEVSASLGDVRLLQGRITGKIHLLGFRSKEERNLETLTQDVMRSSEVEGEKLDYEQIRSSVARRLGMDTAGLIPSARNVEGVVEMMLDATQNNQDQLTEERLFGWHAALFPTGYSGMNRISVAQYRKGEMKVVSGAIGKEKIHYEAVDANDIGHEMNKFLSWLNDDKVIIDIVLKAAIAHLWFLTIHPFEDGNGRIARAISDMMLARSENSSERFYSMSKQILAKRSEYYEVLKRAQRNDGEITEWLTWFLNTLKGAMQEAEDSMKNIMIKAAFWEGHREIRVSERQRLMLNKMFDESSIKLTTSKWAKITKCSADTALRDINDLIEKGILIKDDAGGRSANYRLV
ncbi:MAG: Fic family protein [Methanomassiliicoccaceae archaeon]|nr:Fic family protein [Methanomassiliicoccaceae archaeon]